MNACMVTAKKEYRRESLLVNFICFAGFQRDFLQISPMLMERNGQLKPAELQNLKIGFGDKQDSLSWT